MVIHLDDARYLLIKWGFQVLVRSLLPTNTFTGFLRFEEKIVINRESGLLKTLRRLNGDETSRGPSKSFKSSEEARIELDCLAFQIRQIEKIKLVWKA